MKLLCVLGLLSLYVALILAQSNTNTTEGPTTATAAPVTTAGANTTTTLSPNTTTVAPVTNTTTVAPTTSAAPSPSVAGNFYYLEKDDDICILLSVDMAFNISYDKNDNTKASVMFALPSNTSVTIDGSCSPSDQYMTMTWPEAGTDFSVRLNFFEDSSKQQYMNNIILNYVMNDALFPGTNVTGPQVVNKTGSFFQVSETNQYLCKSNLTTEISADVKMITSEMILQAFRTGNTTEFTGTRQQCPEDAETNNIVPIAVGAALAALVVIVLIAYLISRNRNKGGYESV